MDAYSAIGFRYHSGGGILWLGAFHVTELGPQIKCYGWMSYF